MNANQSDLSAVAVIFTHPPDYPAATIATRCMARLGVDAVWAIDANDSTDGIPAGTVITHSHVPRNGNLLGTLWIAEQLRIMEESTAGYEWVIKLDSDTIITGLNWLKAAEARHMLVGCFYPYGREDRKYLCGQAYAVRRSALPVLRASPNFAHPSANGAGEDITIGRILHEKNMLTHMFNPRRGMLSGWSWNTTLPARTWLSSYEVLTIQPNRSEDRLPELDPRREVVMVMEWLEKELQSMQTDSHPVVYQEVPPPPAPVKPVAPMPCDASKPVLATPSLATMVAGLVKATVAEVKATANGEEPVSEAEEARRLAICQQPCDKFIVAQGRCSLCGCFMKFKAKLRSQHCPENKW